MDAETMNASANNDSRESRSAGAELSEHIFEGYSDNKLETLADPSAVNTGRAPSVYWTSELYSFGRLYREWGYYPKYLPLYVYSDHGVHPVSAFSPHEISNNAKVHFTFNKARVTANTGHTNKEVICVPHPWVSYRRRKNIVQSDEAKGTLVFFTHSCDGIEFFGHDSDEYFDELNQLPDECKPIVLCMHMYEINNGYHKKLRKHGLPIVTAGNTSSVNFVDRFYNLVSNFRYACSNGHGSQLYYCIEMGIPYFFIGNKPSAVNYTHKEVPLGNLGIYDPIQADIVEIEQNLFRNRHDHVSLHQEIFVEWMLGLNSDVTRLDACWILWRELFRNWKRWPIMLAFRKYGFLGFFKKLYQHYWNGKY